MLEAVIPAVWSAVHGWFTPAVLFLVLNIVIGTIAVTSKVAASSSSSAGEGDAAGGGGAGGFWAGGGGGGGDHRRLSRFPSMALDRLRSFNLSGRFAAAAPEPAVVAGVLDLGAGAHDEASVKEVGESEREREMEHEDHAHMERSKSEAAAAELPRLPARLRKSASDRSAFAHFEAENEERADAVEARRPATTRDQPRVWLRATDASEPESDSGDEVEPDEMDDAAGEVDARADDFINNFRHQLKLQRIDSYLRHRDMLRRGHAAAVATD
ncbi:eukaryotic translation initiation factor 4B2-like [Oryza brachyantha]|uniref:eukaryotic translation initiation factor 4B2-like n=1 Tax=Oryza brachyantha TaxID=4533 RepID=UPI001ADA7BFE|nr:eukaryotic translation initiation factor 4B2-like [Oryza brachyantha]